MLGFQFDLRSLLLLIGSASACGASLMAGHYAFSCGFAVAVGILVCVASWRDEIASSDVMPLPAASGSPVSSR